MSAKLLLYYGSAGLAVAGSILYHVFAKRIPATLDPLVSITATYILITLFGFVLLPFSLGSSGLAADGLWGQLRQLGIVQVMLALAIMMIEVGFVMMYRTGWDLSLANVLTSVVINLVLLAIGVLALKEGVSLINVGGILLCIAGVAMIAWK